MTEEAWETDRFIDNAVMSGPSVSRSFTAKVPAALVPRSSASAHAPSVKGYVGAYVKVKPA